MAEIKYEIVERIAVLGERPRGWERQLNLISWNEGEPTACRFYQEKTTEDDGEYVVYRCPLVYERPRLYGVYQ